MRSLFNSIIACCSSLFLLACGSNDDVDYLSRVAFADGDGSVQADGTLQSPYSIVEAINSGKEVVVVLDSCLL